MTTANSPASKEVVTAALLVIGSKIFGCTNRASAIRCPLSDYQGFSP
jgi:hypothetical protein